MTPLERYQVDLLSLGYDADPAQEAAVRALDRVYHDLLAAPASEDETTSWLGRLRRRPQRAPTPSRRHR